MKISFSVITKITFFCSF